MVDLSAGLAALPGSGGLAVVVSDDWVHVTLFTDVDVVVCSAVVLCLVGSSSVYGGVLVADWEVSTDSACWAGVPTPD